MKRSKMPETGWLLVALVSLGSLARGLRLEPATAAFNINQNRTIHPLDYWGERDAGHNFTASPTKWRFPFYSLMLDRFVNGDPTNENANGTLFEHDIYSNQMRHSGDVDGLVDSLDYIQGMGIKAIYLIESILINQPWAADSYSPLDLTLLDFHFGGVEGWLIGFDSHLNDSTPFALQEHKAVWKTSRRYMDFDIGNEYNKSGKYPA